MVKKALLIIDMQNDFVAEEAPFKCEGAREIIPAVIEAIEFFRENDLPVIHVYQEHRKQLVDFGRELDRSKPHCIEGTYGAEIIPEIEVSPNDFTLLKRRFSSFLYTDLDLLLKGLEVGEIYLCGVAADGCIRATAVDAHQLGYFFHVLEDASAGITKDSCAAALKYLNTLQRNVLITVEEMKMNIGEKNSENIYFS